MGLGEEKKLVTKKKYYEKASELFYFFIILVFVMKKVLWNIVFVKKINFVMTNSDGKNIKKNLVKKKNCDVRIDVDWKSKT